jgi:hypothetical protein
LCQNRRQEARLSQWIINKIHELCGRFLVFHEAKGLYSEMKNSLARQKTNLEFKQRTANEKRLLKPMYAVKAHDFFFSNLKLKDVLLKCGVKFDYTSFMECMAQRLANGLEVPPEAMEIARELETSTRASPHRNQKPFSETLSQKKLAESSRMSLASLPHARESLTRDLGKSDFATHGLGVPLHPVMSTSILPLRGVFPASSCGALESRPFAATLSFHHALEIPHQKIHEEVLLQHQSERMMHRAQLSRLEAGHEMLLPQRDLAVWSLHHPMSVMEQEQLMMQRRKHGMDFQGGPPVRAIQASIHPGMQGYLPRDSEPFCRSIRNGLPRFSSLTTSIDEKTKLEDILGLPSKSNPEIRKMALEMAEAALHDRKARRNKQMKFEKIQNDKAQRRKAKIANEKQPKKEAYEPASNNWSEEEVEDDDSYIVI